MTITVIDPSAPTKEEGLRINMFAANEQILAHIKNKGDIFRAHRLKVYSVVCLSVREWVECLLLNSVYVQMAFAHQIQRYEDRLQGMGNASR